jgi:hypothetical protein
MEKTKKGGAVAESVEWDGSAFRVPADMMASWRKAFPAISVEAAVMSAAAWVADNPGGRGKKRQWSRFLLNWLRRTRPGEAPVSEVDPGDPLPPPVQDPEPAGWREAYEDLYDHAPERGWHEHNDDVQDECRGWLRKRRVA